MKYFKIGPEVQEIHAWNGHEFYTCKLTPYITANKGRMLAKVRVDQLPDPNFTSAWLKLF